MAMAVFRTSPTGRSTRCLPARSNAAWRRGRSRPIAMHHARPRPRGPAWSVSRATAARPCPRVRAGPGVQSHPHHPGAGAQARGDPRVARRSGPGICRHRWRRCGSAWRQAGMAASRWCASSPVHGITVSRRSPPPVPRRWRPAAAMPTSFPTSPPGAASPAGPEPGDPPVADPARHDRLLAGRQADEAK